MLRHFLYQDRKFEEMYYQELIAKEQAAQRDASPRKGPRDGSPRRGEEDQGSYMDQFQKNKNKKVRVEQKLLKENPQAPGNLIGNER